MYLSIGQMMKSLNKLFQIRCNRCHYSEFSTGLSSDLKHLFEIKKCKDCGGKRKFRCPKCGNPATMTRLARNSDVK